MRKTLLLPILALAVAPAMAVKITPDQALQRLKSETSGQLPILKLTRGSEFKLTDTLENLYVFSNDDGFMVLPAYDEAPALLAYSDGSPSGWSESGLKENPGLKYWLDFYNQELAILNSSALSVTNSDKVSEEKKAERAPIAPLLTTKWNQEAPYNMLCPKVDGHETVTGCVATAMAQVMKYHNYPDHGKGTHSYFWRPGEEELTFDYDTTPFQWDLMTDVYDDKSSEESKYAVAVLMYGCGVSVNMHYEPGGSGAATTQMGASLIDIFDYSPSLWMPNRAYYGYYEWEDMIYADLEQGLPVLYSGAGTAGGHQFICDGYSSDGYFHFNWGWGGISNGYFLLTALNPDDLGVGGGAGGFNTSQIATLGVRPKKDGDAPVYLFYNNTGFEAETTDVEAGKDFRCTGLYFNYSLSTMPAGSRLGMKFESSDKTTVKFVDGPGVEGYHPDDGRNDLQVVFPELADGTYEITPVLHVDGKWYPVRMPLGEPSVVTVTVENGKVTVENQKAATVMVKDIKVPAKIYRDHEFPMTFVVENSSDKEYYSTVTPLLMDSEGKIVSKSVFRPVDVMPESSEHVTDYIGKFSPGKDETLEPGTYTLLFRDEAGQDVSKPIDVSLGVNDETTVIKITDFSIDEKEPITDTSAVKITFTVTCESGVYYNATSFAVFPGDGGYEVYRANSERVYLTPGESRNIVIIANMDELKDGWYMSFIYEGAKSMTERKDFHIERDASAINTISAEEDTASYYRLDGTKVEGHQLEPGIYVMKTATRTIKVVIH